MNFDVPASAAVPSTSPPSSLMSSSSPPPPGSQYFSSINYHSSNPPIRPLLDNNGLRNVGDHIPSSSSLSSASPSSSNIYSAAFDSHTSLLAHQQVDVRSQSTTPRVNQEIPSHGWSSSSPTSHQHPSPHSSLPLNAHTHPLPTPFMQNISSHPHAPQSASHHFGSPPSDPTSAHPALRSNPSLHPANNGAFMGSMNASHGSQGPNANSYFSSPNASISPRHYAYWMQSPMHNPGMSETSGHGQQLTQTSEGSIPGRSDSGNPVTHSPSDTVGYPPTSLNYAQYAHNLSVPPNAYHPSMYHAAAGAPNIPTSATHSSVGGYYAPSMPGYPTHAAHARPPYPPVPSSYPPSSLSQTSYAHPARPGDLAQLQNPSGPHRPFQPPSSLYARPTLPPSPHSLQQHSYSYLHQHGTQMGHPSQAAWPSPNPSHFPHPSSHTSSNPSTRSIAGTIASSTIQYGLSPHAPQLPLSGRPAHFQDVEDDEDDDDGEIIHRKALERAESEKSRTKKKRKHEGDDDDDEDFGIEDSDWYPGSKPQLRSNHKRTIDYNWDQFSGQPFSLPIPPVYEEPAESESLVASRPRRERRTTLKYREAMDSDDDEFVDDDDEDGGSRSKSRPRAKNSSTQPSGNIADEDDEMYGFDLDTHGADDEDDSEGNVIDKILDYREYIDEATLNPNEMNVDGSLKGASASLGQATRALLRGEMNAQTKVNKEYRVKWKGQSYLHCTWETWDALQGVSGLKKLENYVRAATKECQWRKTATVEELEPHDIEIEMLQDLYDEHLKLERVIAVRMVSRDDDVLPPKSKNDGSNGLMNDSNSKDSKPIATPEYLCVWSKLPYVEATWERPEDVAEYQSVIDKFLQRSQQQLLSRTFYGPRVQRPSFRNVQLLQSTPSEWLKGGVLRDYQLQGINWLVFSWCNSTNCILADEMGLGKTIQTISFLGFLQFRQQIPGPFLIVVPLSTIPNWESEFAKWLPDMNTVVYMGDSRSRELIREHEFWYESNGKLTTKFNALITSYEIILKDKQHLGSIKWNYLAVDEAHRLKNSGSALHEALNEFTTSSRLLITGTPLQNSLKELWSLLNFLEPGFFPSMSTFEREYSSLEGEGQLAALHQRLKPHVLRRFKHQVEKSLPAKNERILRVGMAPIQRKYYRWIITRNFAELNRGLRGQELRTLSNIVVELKKVCNHPFLFANAQDQAREMASKLASTSSAAALPINTADSRGGAPSSSTTMLQKQNEAMLDLILRSSAKLMLLDKLLVRLKETGHRVLIFSQMVRMLDILSEYLRLRGFFFQRLDGSMSRSARQMAMESFNAEGSKDFCFILSTRAGGLGINLATADTVIIFDSDWNPQNDLQAQSRAHRIGQKHIVNIYRFMVKDSVEENILERAKKKLVLDHLVIQRMSGKSGSVSSTSANSGPGDNAKGGMFSKNELADILKFGAEELFKTREDDQYDTSGAPIVSMVKNQLLEEMDIDEILARAEPASEMIQPGLELLSAFKVADFSTTTADDDEDTATDKKKSDNFWDRIVPVELRPTRSSSSDIIMTGPRARKKRVEVSDIVDSSTEMSPPKRPSRAAARRKPSISSTSSSGTTGITSVASSSSTMKNLSSNSIRNEDSEDDDEDALEHGVQINASGGSEESVVKKKRIRTPKKKIGCDELDASDVRKLLTAVRTYGASDMKKVITQAGLANKSPGLVENMFNEIMSQCRLCLEDASSKHTSSSGARSSAMTASGGSNDLASSTGDSLPSPTSSSNAKSDLQSSGTHAEDGSKANSPKTTIKYLDVPINATQLITRLNDLNDLSANVRAYTDPYAFRLNVVVKPWPPFSAIWSSPVDDSMLLLGVYLYGFGQWKELPTDNRLGLACKIFGPDQPTTLQLTTRVEALFKAIRDAKDSKSRADLSSVSPGAETAKKAKRAKPVGNSTAATPTKVSKPKPRKKKEAKAAATQVVEPEYPIDLVECCEKLWSPHQALFAQAYQRVSVLTSEEEKVEQFRVLLTSIRQQVHELAQMAYSTHTQNGNDFTSSFSPSQVSPCLWSHAAKHICGGTKSGIWLQTTADQLANLNMSLMGSVPTNTLDDMNEDQDQQVMMDYQEDDSPRNILHDHHVVLLHHPDQDSEEPLSYHSIPMEDEMSRDLSSHSHLLDQDDSQSAPNGPPYDPINPLDNDPDSLVADLQDHPIPTIDSNSLTAAE